MSNGAVYVSSSDTDSDLETFTDEDSQPASLPAVSAGCSKTLLSGNESLVRVVSSDETSLDTVDDDCQSAEERCSRLTNGAATDTPTTETTDTRSSEDDDFSWDRYLGPSSGT